VIEDLAQPFVQNAALTKHNEILSRNISCLFKTASREISLRDTEIRLLRRRNQDPRGDARGVDASQRQQERRSESAPTSNKYVRSRGLRTLCVIAVITATGIRQIEVALTILDRGRGRRLQQLQHALRRRSTPITAHGAVDRATIRWSRDIRPTIVDSNNVYKY
jgi:hypothetical protein